MKISEVINPKPVIQQPSLINQQQRVAKVLKQRIGSEQQQGATEMDKVLAMQQHAALKKQTDTNYAKRVQQQSAKAQAFVQT